MEKKLTLDERLDLEARLIDTVYDTDRKFWDRWGDPPSPAEYLDAIMDLLREKGVL